MRSFVNYYLGNIATLASPKMRLSAVFEAIDAFGCYIQQSSFYFYTAAVKHLNLS